jgi:2,4-dienoyl-CoA reductase (NADPH2)
MDFTNLFTPITIKNLTIPNRIVLPAMGLLYSQNSEFNDRYHRFYTDIARGNCGLILIGPAAVDLPGSSLHILALHNDRYIKAYRDFIREAKQISPSKIGIQLFHLGINASEKETGAPPLSPTAVHNRYTGETSREMTIDDIEQVKAGYKAAALRALEAGFDYIEISCNTGYLISQFLSGATNKREDTYGGPIQNRIRFGIEVIDTLRQTLPHDFPLGIKISGADFIPNGNTIEDSVIFCKEAADHGIDAVSVTGGWHSSLIPQINYLAPPGTYTYLAREIKANLDVPVFSSIRLNDLYLAEELLQNNYCDMICLGRQLIADPFYPIKVQKGDLKSIVYCLACNKGCFDSIMETKPIYCIQHQSKIPAGGTGSTGAKKRIIIAGGGIAGMQNAVYAAEMGMEVIVYEKAGILGGKINSIKNIPQKDHYITLIHRLEYEIETRDITVKRESELSTDIIIRENPDILLIATGSYMEENDFQKQPQVYSCLDILTGNYRPLGKNIIIAGGNAAGCETAYFLARKNVVPPGITSFLRLHNAEDHTYINTIEKKPYSSILIIEKTNRFATNMSYSTRLSLIKTLKLYNVKFLPRAVVTDITPGSVRVEKKNGSREFPASAVVRAYGWKPHIPFDVEAIKSKGIRVILAGDAHHIGTIEEALKNVWEEAVK